MKTLLLCLCLLVTSCKSEAPQVQSIDKQIDAVEAQADASTDPDEIKALHDKIAELVKERDAAIKSDVSEKYGGIFDLIASTIPLPVSMPLKQAMLALSPLLFTRPRKAILTAVSDAASHTSDVITSTASGDAAGAFASVGKAVISPLGGVAKAIGLLHTTPPKSA